MTETSEQFRQSDVTAWGIVALVCAGIAVIGANVAGLVPETTLTALHLPNGNGVSLTQLRQQVAELRAETIQLRRQNEMLNTRFSLQEQSGNEVVRRVGALEVSMPSLIETKPLTTPVDRSVTTASIGVSAPQEFEAEGGSVVVHQSPMLQPLPNPLRAPVAVSGAEVGYAVAIGANFAAGQGAAQWQDIKVRFGSVLGDLKPLVADGASSDQQRLVVGPIAELSAARDLCQRLEQMEIACMPASFAGLPLVR